MLRRAWQTVTRLGAFVRKEIVETVRQPRLMFALVLGPFLILLIFGAGLREGDPPVRTVFVTPRDGQLTEQVERFAEAQSERLTVLGIHDDEEQALRQLRQGQLDMVMVFPDEAVETVRDDEHATVTIYHNLLDPIEAQAVELFARTGVDEVNKLVQRTLVAEAQEDASDAVGEVGAVRTRVAALEQAAEEGDEFAVQEQQSGLQDDVAALTAVLGPAVGILGASSAAIGGAEEQELSDALAEVEGGTEDVADPTTSPEPDELATLDEDLAGLEESLAQFQELSPSVLVSPFQDDTRRVVSGVISLTDFYAPAVVALLLQHLVVTAIGLSLVREEALGTNELFRVAPLRTFEALLGKAIAYLLLGTVVGIALLATLVLGLGVPVLGAWWLVTLTLAAELLAAIMFGFILALLARTDTQAVQYAMMFLLASVFFSGFLLTLQRFVPAVQYAAYALPVTYATTLLREVMLLGDTNRPELLYGLVGLGAGLFCLAWFMLRRRLQQ